MNREEWLSTMADMMAPVFAANGYTLPKIRMSIGFPSQGSRGKAIGQCWDSSASDDGTYEILIRPDRHEPMDVAAILAHELGHAHYGDERTGNGYYDQRQEKRAWDFAAGLLIHPADLAAAVAWHGWHIPSLADELEVTQHLLNHYLAAQMRAA